MKAITLVCRFAVFAALISPAAVHSSEHLSLNRNFEFSAITKYTEIYYDPCRCLNINSLQDTQLVWKAHHHPFVRLEKEGRYWLRFIIVNNDEIPLFFHIRASSIELHEMRMFVYSKEYGWDSTAVTGNYIPVRERPIPDRHLMYTYLLYPQVIYTLYVYMEKSYAPVQTALDMSSPLSKIDDNNLRKGSYLHGAVVGFSIMHFIMALFILFFLRNSFHLAHVSYALGGVGYLLASNGAGIDYIWINAIYFEEYSAEIFATLMLTGLVWMAKIQLKTKSHRRWLYYLINLAILSGWLLIIAVSFRFVFPSDMIVYITLMAGCFAMCTLPCVMAVAIIDFFKYKNWDSLWFVLVFAAVMAASMLMLITELGIIERTIYVNNTLNLHSGYMQTFFVTLFVANRSFIEINSKKIALLEQQLVHEQAFQRISRDLHDEVGSTLSSIAILGDATLQNLRPGLEQTRLAIIIERARQVMETMSDIVWSISAENDTVEALMFRMREFVGEILAPKMICTHFDLNEKVLHWQLTMEQRKELYLIFKESINNIAKYAQAKNVWIHLKKEKKHIHLRVKDDGVGFDKYAVQQGNGLRNMEARAQAIAGQFKIISEIGYGTELTLSFPIT